MNSKSRTASSSEGALRHVLDRWLSRRIDTRRVETVCLALGPYRNLTTLTASILALHPNCQVLNHGGSRIFPDPKLNFLTGYDDRKFEAFVRYAIHISSGGTQGQHGGSITNSHAFSRDPMRQAYAARYGDTAVKPDIRSVFWKESLRTSNLLRDQRIDLGPVFERNARLRFLMPVRHPLDCAVSNIKTGHVQLFGLTPDASVQDVLERVLQEFAWFLALADRHPDRFFHFFEYDMSREVVHDLAAFLRLPADERWVDTVLATFQVSSSYRHAADDVAGYEAAVQRLFADRPAVAERLRRFVAAPATPAARPTPE